jgi:hypothetical protein
MIQLLHVKASQATGMEKVFLGIIFVIQDQVQGLIDPKHIISLSITICEEMRRMKYPSELTVQSTFGLGLYGVWLLCSFYLKHYKTLWRYCAVAHIW